MHFRSDTLADLSIGGAWPVAELHVSVSMGLGLVRGDFQSDTLGDLSTGGAWALADLPVYVTLGLGLAWGTSRK